MTNGASSSNRSFKSLSWAEAKEVKIRRVEGKCFMFDKGLRLRKWNSSRTTEACSSFGLRGLRGELLRVTSGKQALGKMAKP